MEQLEHVQAQLGAAQLTCGNVIANLAKELERKNAEIDGMLDGLVDRLTWENVMKEGSAWNACINHIAGFPTAQSLQKFFEWVNCEGVADRLRYWNGKQSMQRMEAEANGTAQRESVGKPEQRTFTTQNALLVTLVKLRTGLGTRVISAWSGIKIMQRGHCIPADKGFDQCEALVVARGARIVAPARRWQGQRHYTADERQGNGEKSNLRIHVERHFSRVQN
eukprot:jgi/Tetstr1/466402/TSEL_010931.t1